MNASDFADLWADAQSVTVVHRTPGALDFDSQSVAAFAESSESTLGLVRQWQLDKIDGQIVQVNDRRVLLDPSSLAATPTGSDELEIDSQRYEIVAVRIFAPEGEVIAYDCHIRGTA